jgi:hypothetical protein
MFSLARILVNLRRHCLQSKHLERLNYMNKNWPNDCRVGCKSPSNLSKLIGIDVDLEEKLEQFEKDFCKR